MAERIGPYLVLRQLGAGAHGVVHEAVDEALGRRVALKLLEPTAGADAHVRRRFARDAAALAALDSRHLVRVFGHGEHDGRLWVASRLAPGADLGRLLDREGPLPVPRALELVAQVAAGLADAHEVGLTHGDLTPANVFVERREAGLAAALGDFDLVRTSRGADPVAGDLRALGGLLWTVITGDRPYAGGPVPQLAGTSPRQVAVNRILRATLAGAPAYSSAGRLRDDLLRAAALPHDHRARARRRPAAAGAAVAGLVVGLLVFGLLVGEEPEPVADPARAPRVGSAASPAAARPAAAAVTSLAHALHADGALPPGRATCTARHWIDNAGLGRLVAEGLFDERLRYVERPAAAMSPALRSAAAAAVLHCRPR